MATGGQVGTMQILVINSGSSSIKFSIFAVQPPVGGDVPTVAPRSLFEGSLSDIGDAESTLTIHATGEGAKKSAVSKVGIHGVEQAIAEVLEVVSDSGVPAFEAVGYRVVHPGPKLREHVRITPEVIADLKAASEFAPLHDPEAVQMIRAFMKRFPTLPHYACFDTVFHQTMPVEASDVCVASRICGARRAAVRVSWAELRVDCAPVEARGRCATADGDCASGQRLQRDGAGRWVLGGHDDGVDADGRGGDGNAARGS